MRYRKKPVVVEAMQWYGSALGATIVIDWVLANGGTARLHEDEMRPGQFVLMIDTLEGTHKAVPSNWIIKGVAGEFYPCKPDIFQQTYEVAA